MECIAVESIIINARSRARRSGGNRAILVHMDINDEAHRENLSEFKELVAFLRR